MELEAIIIITYPSRDADLVLRVITKNNGKLSLLAKYARKSKKRFGNTFDLFDHGIFTVNQGMGSLMLVQAYASKSFFQGLRDNLDKMAAASLLCESFDHLIKEDSKEDSEIVFDTLALGLQAIEESSEQKATLKALYLALGSIMRICGYLNSQEAGSPSAKNLLKLIEQIEYYTERELKSKGMIEGLIKMLLNNKI